MADVLIGVDLGTSGSKAVATTPDGRILATATRSRPHSMSMPRPGWAEVDAETVWWGDVIALCRELTDALDGAPVAAVCVSGVGPCLVLCDEDDRPVRPAVLYGIDMRATAEIDELTAEFGADEILRRCGKALSTQAVGPKIRWVARHEPEVFARARRWYGSSSYVVRKLTGEYVLDHPTASQCDPLYDLEARTWERDWAGRILQGLELPPLAWPGELVGRVTADAAARTGLPAGTPVCAGTVDAWSEAFSAGIRGAGDMMVMYGSTMFLIRTLDAVRVHPSLWTTTGVDRDTYTLSAGMATAGLLASWWQEVMGGADLSTLVAEAERVPPGADGLLMLPYFAGERSPIFDPRARGVVAGLSLRHTRAHLFRAAYEGVAFGVRQLVELMDSPDDPVERMLAVGGGTRGGLWTQIVSDVTGRVQLVPAQTIGACYGGALLAAIGAGLVPGSTDWTSVAHEVHPDPAAQAVYAELYEAFRELYPGTRPLVHRLAERQERET